MTMCYHPWVGLDISPQGEYKPCCKFGPVLGTSLTEYQTSEKLAQLKEQFLAGERPDECARCWKDEDADLPSKRTLDNKYIFNDTAPALTSFKVLSVPFGNTCNLACRICSSYPSSRWGQEAEKLKPYFPDIPIYKHNKFYQTAEFKQSIDELSKDVVHVTFPGGEPFYADSETHYEFLMSMLDRAPEISLHYITNGTKMPGQEMFHAWDKFKQVDIQLSIDGILDQFEYNRWPALWPQVYANVQKYQRYALQHRNIKLSISHSVSIFTVYYLPQFLEWCKMAYLPAPYLGLVSNPLHYSITALPAGAKQAIEAHFHNDPRLTGIVKAMWAKDDSDQLDLLVKYVKILDKQRQQNFAETFPELYNLLGEQCQTLYQLY